jgi:uncharacterized protein
VRVFPDTNVVASAFGTRGLCADVLRVILREHELATSEVLIEELRGVLRRKFGVPTETVNEIESFLRGYHVEPKPRELPNLKLADHNDLVVVASAIKANAEILVTGDQEILELGEKPEALRVCSPRDFWDMSKERQRRVR